MKEPVILHVNGVSHTVNVDPSTPLLYVLRNQLSLNGPKYGCGLDQCGACMVLLDGKAQTSCLLPVSSVKNRRITTLEGLSQKNNELHPVQKAFVQEQAAQCGYCMNGMVMAAVALLADNPHPDRKTIRNRLHLSLCRCGSHARILRAIQRAIELV